jgi:hypothetical protein
MTREEIAELAEGYDELLLADGFEDAFVGIAERCGSKAVAVYDYELAVRALTDRDGMSEEEAREYLDFNVLGAYVGETTPWFITTSRQGPGSHPSRTSICAMRCTSVFTPGSCPARSDAAALCSIAT